MLTLAPCLALALLGADGGPPPKAWVDRLTSAGPEARFEAVDALDALGLKALPALREAVARGGGEARRLASEQIDRIGASRLLRPTIVAVEPRDTNVADALAALKGPNGFLIDIDPARTAALADRKIDLGPSAPLGFFETLDRLGAAGGLRHDPSPYFSYPPPKGVRVRLVAFDAPPPPTAYAGPYRLTLMSLNRHREVAQARDPADAMVREDFAARFEIAAEPGVLIERNGPIRLQEATDDRGRELRPSSSADAGGASFSMRQWGQERISTLSMSLPLALPEGRGRAIARLRGYVPIIAVARLDEMFSAPAAGLEGKTLSGGGVSLRVVRSSLARAPYFLEIAVKGEPAPDPRAFASGPRQATLATIKVGSSPDDHLRIEDANGVPYGTNANATAPPAPDGTMTFRVNLFANRQAGPPSRVRYFGVAAVATEIPFDFRDLPIP